VDGQSSENQFAVLLLILQDYGILHKLGAIMGDNASTNNTLYREVQEYLLNEEGLTWDSLMWRIRYIGHIINLAIQAFLFGGIVKIKELESYDEMDKRGETANEEARKAKFRLMGPLGQLHNIIIHIKGSTIRIAH
jgi:hypothetical protein